MPTPHRPLRVAVLCSAHAPGLLYLLNRAPDRGATFEIVCVVSSEPTFAEEVRVERRGIPTLARPIRAFYDGNDPSLVHGLRVRAAYDQQTADVLEPFMPDLLLLDGYRYLVTAPLLAAFPARMIGLQFGDLTIRHLDGPPMFSGPHAVRDAILAGCSETHATVHLVTEHPDAGAPIVRSWPFPVSPLVEVLQTKTARDAVDAYIFAHQQWMARSASGPLMAAALRLIATRAVDLQAMAAMPPAWPWQLEADGDLLNVEPDTLLYPAAEHAFSMEVS
jgi:phosphoribosylglycinamide formyltransferase-1